MDSEIFPDYITNVGSRGSLGAGSRKAPAGRPISALVRLADSTWHDVLALEGVSDGYYKGPVVHRYPVNIAHFLRFRQLRGDRDFRSNRATRAGVATRCWCGAVRDHRRDARRSVADPGNADRAPARGARPRAGAPVLTGRESIRRSSGKSRACLRRSTCQTTTVPVLFAHDGLRHGRPLYNPPDCDTGDMHKQAIWAAAHAEARAARRRSCTWTSARPATASCT